MSSTSTEGTVVVTGANGTLGLEYVKQLISTYPTLTAILTVRDPSPTDVNTQRLRRILSTYPSSKASIHKLDLNSLTQVRSFASSIAAQVSSGTIPRISAIVCNAFAWGLSTGQRFAEDGYDLTFQVCHLSHMALVIQLLDSMCTTDGRVVILGTEAHDSAVKNMMSSLPAEIPTDLEQLVKPLPDKKGSEKERGFQRYATSKLCQVMFMHELNRRLEATSSPQYKSITALAMDPSGMPASRAFATEPFLTRFLMNYIIGPLTYILKFFTDKVRLPADSARDLVEVSVSESFRGKRGYYFGKEPKVSSVDSLDKEKQMVIWRECVRWVGIRKEDTQLDVFT